MASNHKQIRPIRTFTNLQEAKRSVSNDGYRYEGHESYKEYKILYDGVAM